MKRTITIREKWIASPTSREDPILTDEVGNILEGSVGIPSGSVLCNPVHYPFCKCGLILSGQIVSPFYPNQKMRKRVININFKCIFLKKIDVPASVSNMLGIRSFRYTIYER